MNGKLLLLGIGVTVGSWTAIIACVRLLMGYGFVESLILMNIGIISFGVTYLVAIMWFNQSEEVRKALMWDKE